MPKRMMRPLQERAMRSEAGSAIVDVHGADQAAAALHVSEDVADEIGGGGLAVGAGDAQDMNFVAGMLEEGVGQERGGGGDVFDDDLRKRRAGNRLGRHK